MMTDAQLAQRIAEMTSAYAQDPKFPNVINNKNLYHYFIDKQVSWIYTGEPMPSNEEARTIKTLAQFYEDSYKAQKREALLQEWSSQTAISSLFL